jgi:hypothetical protein
MNKAPLSCPKVPGSNPASPQPTADCHLQVGCHQRWDYLAIGCPLGGDRGKESPERTGGPPKKKKKKLLLFPMSRARPPMPPPLCPFHANSQFASSLPFKGRMCSSGTQPQRHLDVEQWKCIIHNLISLSLFSHSNLYKSFWAMPYVLLNKKF